uniref:Uncharacterized protein n=1 Tax=Onchocerca volvulus TaxID=6282 RepID=A0A8R1TMF9_ONCVO
MADEMDTKDSNVSLSNVDELQSSSQSLSFTELDDESTTVITITTTIMTTKATTVTTIMRAWRAALLAMRKRHNKKIKDMEPIMVEFFGLYGVRLIYRVEEEEYSSLLQMNVVDREHLRDEKKPVGKKIIFEEE